MSSWACVSGRRTPRPPSRHVVHAWIPGTSYVVGRRLPGRRPTHVRRPLRRGLAGLRDRPSLAGTHLPLCAAVPHPRRRPRRRFLRAKPAAAARYSRSLRRCPTSGTARPLGSSPVDTAASRPAARATTPSAEPNGASVSSSPWTTATTTGAGAAVPPVTRSASSARRAATWASGRGRPSCGSGGEVGGGEHVQPGQCLQGRGAPDPRPGGPAPPRLAPPRPAPDRPRRRPAPSRRRPVERRGRPRRAQARLRRGCRPAAAVDRVVVQSDERVAGAFDRRRDARQRDDRGERVGGSSATTPWSHTGGEPARPDGATDARRRTTVSPQPRGRAMEPRPPGDPRRGGPQKMSGATLDNLSTESRSFSAARGVRRAGQRHGRVVRARRRGPRRVLGRAGGATALGPALRPACSTGSRRSRSGSSAASSTSRTTASTVTSRRATASRSRSTGRASRATRAPSPTPTCSARCAGPRTR